MADANRIRVLSLQYGIGVVYFVGVIDVLMGVFRTFRMMDDSNNSMLVAGLLPIALLSGKLVALSGLSALRRWGYEWTLRVYAFSGLLNLVTLNILGLLFDVVILLQLSIRSEYFR